MNLTIDASIRHILPEFDIIAYTMDVSNQTTEPVTQLLKVISSQYQAHYQITDVVQIPKIKEARDGYKALGKDPSHTRLACEALLRRILKGTGLYMLGDLIDLGNILSLITMRSVCVVDLHKIVGDVRIRLGQASDQYEAIHRGILNVTDIPVYQDDISLFGNPTSDTFRTAISNATSSILVMLICFGSLEKAADEAQLLELFLTYANAKNIKKVRVEVSYDGKF